MPPLPAVAQPAVAMVELAKPMAIVSIPAARVYDVPAGVAESALSVPLAIDKVTFVLPLVQRFAADESAELDAVSPTPCVIRPRPVSLPSVNWPS